MPRSWTALGVALTAALLSSVASSMAGAADPESCKPVRFSDVGWTDITATTAAASVVLEGLGYEPSARSWPCRSPMPA